jgi:phage/conjugal plasmid C-4 type zinc finger TraR family protein
MAGGWSRDGAVQEQIDASVEDAVLRARSALPRAGASRTHCAACEVPIPEARRLAVPGVRLCVACQAELDDTAPATGFNRRGSKDSQLR